MTHRDNVWRQVREELIVALKELGLVEGRDYFVQGEDSPHHYTVLALTSISSLTVNLLRASSVATLHKDLFWGAIVTAPLQEHGEAEAIVEMSGGAYSLSRGGQPVLALVKAAYEGH